MDSEDRLDRLVGLSAGALDAHPKAELELAAKDLEIPNNGTMTKKDLVREIRKRTR